MCECASCKKKHRSPVPFQETRTEICPPCGLPLRKYDNEDDWALGASGTAATSRRMESPPPTVNPRPKYYWPLNTEIGNAKKTRSGTTRVTHAARRVYIFLAMINILYFFWILPFPFLVLREIRLARCRFLHNSLQLLLFELWIYLSCFIVSVISNLCRPCQKASLQGPQGICKVTERPLRMPNIFKFCLLHFRS